MLAAQVDASYSPFPKHDRPRPFQRLPKASKLRLIDNPNDALKQVQARINERLLGRVHLPDNIFGGVKGKGVLDNARMHQHAQALVKLDISRFFPSITHRHVYGVWCSTLGCSPRISSLLTRLTTFHQHLPQGAPTSTSLANLVLNSIDGPIRHECERRGIVYSSWVDDLPFSCDDPRPIINVVITTLRESGFRISRKKLEIAGPGSRKIINGVLLGPQLGIPRERLSCIRSGINKLRRHEVRPPEIEGYVRRLRGNIAYVSSIAPVKAARLRAQLEATLQHQPDAQGEPTGRTQ